PVGQGSPDRAAAAGQALRMAGSGVRLASGWAGETLSAALPSKCRSETGRKTTAKEQPMRYLMHAGGAGALGLMLAGWTALPLAAQGARVDTLPTRYAAHRWVAAPVLESGDTLALFTDTGGGTNMLWPATLKRLGLTAEWVQQGGDSMRVVSLPAMRAGAAIPLPAARSEER